MSRAGWALFTLSWAWGLYLVAFVVTYERAFPRNISPVELIGLILLTLAIFSNLVLWASRTVDQSNPVPTSWRVLLVGFLAVNISVAFFLADFRALFGYWLWVTGFAVRTWALLALPPDTAAPKSSDSALSDDSVPEIVLVALGVTIFWLGVTVVNYYQFNRHLPRKRRIRSRLRSTPVFRIRRSMISRSAQRKPPDWAARVSTTASFSSSSWPNERRASKWAMDWKAR